MESPSQTFKIFEMTGKVSSVSFSVKGGCNIHQAVNKHLNDLLQAESPFDPSDLSRLRNFRVVYGNQMLDALHAELFAEGAKDKPDFDDKFDNYYARTFLRAENENRSLQGKEFSEQAFVGAPDSMSVHVTIALS